MSRKNARRKRRYNRSIARLLKKPRDPTLQAESARRMYEARERIRKAAEERARCLRREMVLDHVLGRCYTG